MVDFDNEGTVGTPATNIVRILILQRRSDLFEAWESYKKKSYKNIDADAELSVVKARLDSYFLELQAWLKRKLKKEDYDNLASKIKSDDEEEIYWAICFLNEQLDILKLIKLDTKEQYEKSRVEKEHFSKRL